MYSEHQQFKLFALSYAHRFIFEYLDRTTDAIEQTKDRTIASWNYRHIPPVPTPKAPGSMINTSGLDCFLVLVRRVYAWDKIHLPEYQDDEQRNPALAYARQTVSVQDILNADSAAIAEWRREKLDVLKKTLLPRPQDNLEECSMFGRLYRAPLILDTFWKWNDFKLWRDILFWDTETTQLKARPREEQERLVGPKARLLRLNCQDQVNCPESLQTFVSSQFGLLQRDDALEIWATFEPAFVWIEYTPNATAPWSFKELQRFDMPVGTFVTKPNGETISDTDASVHSYTLAAVVRFRPFVEQTDYIRTYQTDGTFIKPAVHNKACFNNRWSIEDAGNYYGLLYQLSTGIEFDEDSRESSTSIQRADPEMAAQLDLVD